MLGRWETIKRLIFVMFWPASLILPFILPLPLVPLLFAVLWAVFASLMLLKSPAFEWRTKIAIVVSWILALGAFGYAFLAWSAMVDSADLGLADPGWTRGFLPAVMVSVLSFAASAIQICRSSRQWRDSRQATGS